MRVYELAKQLEIESKVLISELNRIDIAVSSHSNTLSEDAVQKALAVFGSGKVSSVVSAQGKKGSGAKIIKKPSGRTVKGRGKPAAEFALSPKPEKKHEEEVESLHPLPEIEEVSIQEAQPAVAETEANKEIARFSPEVAAVTEVLGDSLPTLEDLLQQGASAESVPATDETKTSTAKRKTPKKENKGEVIR